MRQGEIWWVEQPNGKRRPALILSRNETLSVLFDVMVAPVTSRIRDLPSEIALEEIEGARRSSVVNVQHVLNVPKSYLREPLGKLSDDRWHEVCAAMRAAIDC